ncbi:hypothetical protein [Streptomyces sindenensis]|uniref:hypothetical protein n=1 Tax=Streptomyces sindenensis TaxID=67363 RepID=UPI0036605DA4
MRSTGTVAELVRRKWGDHRSALKHGPTVLSHHEVVEGAAARAALLADLRPRGGVPHPGVLLDHAVSGRNA